MNGQQNSCILCAKEAWHSSALFLLHFRISRFGLRGKLACSLKA